VVLAIIDIHNVGLHIESKCKSLALWPERAALGPMCMAKKVLIFKTCKCINQALINVSPAALFDIIEQQSQRAASRLFYLFIKSFQ
jgi:hypothetical protein